VRVVATVEVMPLRVVFADDNYLAREGVSALLAEGEGIEVVGTATDLDSLMRSVAEHLPDVVLTDIRMPPTQTDEGIEAALRIRAEHPGVGVVVLSQYVEEDYAFALLAEGAKGVGYLLKERVGDLAEITRALREVARGPLPQCPGRGEAHRVGLPEARARRRTRGQQTGNGGFGLSRGQWFEPLSDPISTGCFGCPHYAGATEPLPRACRGGAH
jgi:DNA-binding NarL/FixJ family response regulator